MGPEDMGEHFCKSKKINRNVQAHESRTPAQGTNRFSPDFVVSLFLYGKPFLR
jgi:hypothetical protein